MIDSLKPALPAIEVKLSSDGYPQFVQADNMQAFTPRGYNYTHVSQLQSPCLNTDATYHSTFNENQFDEAEADNTLQSLSENGYNITRVFLNPECIVNNLGQLSLSYMANLKTFFQLAKKHQIRLIITLDQLPSPLYGDPIQTETDIWWGNLQYLDQVLIAKEKGFWIALISQLFDLASPMDVVFAWELRNEFVFNSDQAPVNQSGDFLAANGQMYSLNSQAEQRRLAQEGFLYWSSEVRQAIKSVDRQALVGVGFFASDTIWNGVAISALTDSELDFIDLHLYQTPDFSFDDYVQYFQLNAHYQKAIIMGETGFVESYGLSVTELAENLDAWLLQSCLYNFSGWLLWTWPTTNSIALSVDDSNWFLTELSPKKLPHVCNR